MREHEPPKEGPENRSERRDRGITSVLQYVLVVFMIAILVSGLLFGFSEVVMNQQEKAVQSNLEVVGQRIANGLTTAERLARDADAQAIQVHLDLPRRVAGIQYEISIVNPDAAVFDEWTIRLQTEQPDVTVRVTFEPEITPVETTVDGGALTIRYDSDADELEVVDDA